MIPIRCYTCNKVTGHLGKKYDELLITMDAGKALDELGLSRYCCRRIMLTYVD